MTALTTILGMSTMALGHGTGAEMMQPMAVVSIGGLTYATLMTLFIVPVLYDIFNGKTMRAREIQMIKEAAGMNGDEILDGDGPVSAAQAVEPSFSEDHAQNGAPTVAETQTDARTQAAVDAQADAIVQPAVDIQSESAARPSNDVKPTAEPQPNSVAQPAAEPPSTAGVPAPSPAKPIRIRLGGGRRP